MQYCIYLRKSRADAEAELRGEGETLARHEKALGDLAASHHLSIKKIYREIVSGETLAARPVARQLLADVMQGLWDGVLVMEIERLARGDTIDQGIVAQAFRLTATKIITPIKTYDPTNEFDEEYFEFGLFMSRREYKAINRRLQRGRQASLREGKYVASRPPYGYTRIKMEKEKGYSLTPHPGQAEVVQLIYKLFTQGESNSQAGFGATRIARELNMLGIPPQRGEKWSPASIRDILCNPVYTGKLRWNWRPAIKKATEEGIITKRPRSAPGSFLIAPGLHPPLISQDIFEAAQARTRAGQRSAGRDWQTVKNPLCGIVFCEICGHGMVRKPHPAAGRPDTLLCSTPGCPNISASLPLVERKVLEELDRLPQASVAALLQEKKEAQAQINCQMLRKAESELQQLSRQLSTLHDLLEQGIYDAATFQERRRSIDFRMNETKKNKAALLAAIQADNNFNRQRPKEQNSILELYAALPSCNEKNRLLKSLLEKATYLKKTNCRWHSPPDDFSVTVYPKLPGRQ